MTNTEELRDLVGEVAITLPDLGRRLAARERTMQQGEGA